MAPDLGLITDQATNKYHSSSKTVVLSHEYYEGHSSLMVQIIHFDFGKIYFP